MRVHPCCRFHQTRWTGFLTAQDVIPATLLLPVRTGLPDAIAFLRDAHPKPRWQHHANYGALAAFWLQVHDTLRAHGRQLQQATRDLQDGRRDAADFQRFFVPALNGFLQHLDGHHRIEDVAYFPRFRMLDRRMAAGFDLLENDHALIHEALLASADGARQLLAVLDRSQDARRRAADVYAARSGHLLALLLRHLEDEEDLVIPAMLEHGERRVS